MDKFGLLKSKARQFENGVNFKRRQQLFSHQKMAKERAQIIARLPLHTILQRLPGVIYVAFIPFCIFGPIYMPVGFAFYYVLLHVLCLVNNLRTYWGARQGFKGSIKHSKTNWEQEFCTVTGASSTSDFRHDLCFDQVKHVIIIPQYKEDLDTIFDTLDVLASHKKALSTYIVL